MEVGWWCGYAGGGEEVGMGSVGAFFLGKLFDMVSDRGVRSGVEADPVSGHLKQLLDF